MKAKRLGYARVRDALEKMSLDAELHLPGLLGTSLKNTKDETLILELALRGYNLSSLRETDETTAVTADIVKIG